MDPHGISATRASSLAKRLTPFVGKKLKRRLEDLERRAGSSDGTSSGNEKPAPATKTTKRAAPQPPKQKTVPAPPPSKHMVQSQFTPPMHNDDEYLFPHAYDERERSNTPPMFTYSAYPPPPEDMLMAPYTAAPSYRTMAAEAYQPDYLTGAVPVTLPPMTHFSDAIKREFPGHDDSLAPYMHYQGYVPGLELSTGAPSPYDHSNPHVSSIRVLPDPHTVREPRC